MSPDPPSQPRARGSMGTMVAITAGGLLLLAGGGVLAAVTLSLLGWYLPGTAVQAIPRYLGFAIVIAAPLVLVALVAVAATGIGRTDEPLRGPVETPIDGPFRTRVRRSIRTRLALSHLVAVTASTFVYAVGGFLLLIIVLYISGYTPRGMVRLIPQFLGVTVFVLIQIALITLCGIVVARIVSQVVSRRMLRQIAELEEGSNAIASGQLTRHVAVLTDDELGRLADRFNHLTSRLRSADSQRRAFVANISHDLRTPIAVISGHLDAQRDANGTSDIPPEVSFAAIEHETATLSRLIEDLFTLSRLEEGVLPVTAVPVDLAGLATSAVAGVRGYALKTARVSVNAQLDESLPMVLGDATRITQIVNNLLHNAVRHTPEGGVVILQALPAAENGWVEVTVRDTGVGISPEVLGRIFERYYRGEVIGDKGGAGIGLSIVKQLVEMQGGSVSAESIVGEGTAVTFRLPAAT